ncbi:hypothetical protein RN001_005076 [Aquatica leii]|uniref:SOCS box domain-containing protein n=1 Tax=Aquatica leii TaxID=1421715 RepID=A0AAN7PBH4_9COLE|nr:hypothetical protein RN001_005076 [Aquatica leii]
MHLHFERTVNAKSDCSILSLTWMGKVPDELPEDDGWKLNRTNYYQEGWLATGNVRGIVGVTFTTSHCKKNVDYPPRTNYNLRGHRSEVILVKWNEPYQKLASCDSSGIIFVWIKYEGRWSIELINDRNTPVTHFSWSHDGRMALICYQDGFVLVGSVAGQRYWSSMLNLEATITCGIWTPDDQQVYFGTTSGQIIVMDVHGAMVSQVQLSADVGISSMAWSCEKFKMEEGDDNDPGVTNATERKFILAVSLQNGFIFLLKTFDDVSPVHVDTGLQGPLCMEWSNSREILAVAGICKNTSIVNLQPEVINMLKFYNDKGTLLYGVIVPCTQTAISALTWGHNDKRIFLATGTQIHIAWVSRRIATLQLLCRLCIHNSIVHESQLPALPLPARIRGLIANLFAQTIRCCVPEASALRDFVAKPPVGSVRLHCTMIRHDEDNNLSSGTCYTLYLEYLGGLVPLLKGKRTSKIRPEFVIFDPQVEDFGIQLRWSSESKSSGSSVQSANGSGALTDSSDSDREEGCAGSPRMQRRRKRRNKSQPRSSQPNHVSNEGDGDDLAYVDTLPEHVRLVEVTSNIWGTKFKIHGLVNSVPANLGQVTYKTSLLHLQPRQMTLVMTELRDDFPTGPDPTFNPNIFSEDEEDINQSEDCPKLHRKSIDHSPPIAPMSPRLARLNRPKSQISNHHITQETNISTNLTTTPALARTESYEEETLFHMADVVSYCENVRPQCSYGHINGQSNGRTCNTVQSTNFMTQYSRTASGNTGNQRHAISPLCCEGSVPALQSPKNAVAPSDIIFDRPPAQTLLSYSTANYTNTSNNVQQVKSNIISDHGRNGISINLSNDQRKPIVVKQDGVDSVNKLCHSNYQNDNTNFISSLNINLRSSACESVSVSNANKKKEVPNRNIASGSAKNETSDKLTFIDEENNEEAVAGASKKLPGASYITDSMIRSCSVGYLDLVDAQLVPSDVALQMLRKDAPKRLVLVNQKTKQKKNSKKQIHENKNSFYKSSRLKNCGKSKSLDSSDIFPSCEAQNIRNIKNHLEEPIPEIENNKNCNEKSSSPSPPSNTIEALSSASKRDNSKLNFFAPKSPLIKRKKSENDLNSDKICKSRSRNKQKTPLCSRKEINGNASIAETNSAKSTPIHTHALSTLENFITRLRDDKSTPPSSPRLPRSSPASPAPAKKGKRPQSASPIRKHLLASPLLGRKSRKNKNQESSDDEVNASGDEVFNGTNYRDLETFQKAQLRQKLKRGKIEPNGTSCNILPSVQRREFVMHNKAPMWNENSQVYQLDFGGRVTQESAKNFQIEFRGKQVMQFGRIDGNAYTLDFQYPFSALQAFAVALANVTQRLK